MEARECFKVFISCGGRTNGFTPCLDRCQFDQRHGGRGGGDAIGICL